MCRHALLLPVLLVVPAFASAQAPPETSETCDVSGTVVRTADGSPLNDATVWMTSADGQQPLKAATTSADGHFELKNILAGQYHLSAERDGYISMQYGQKRAGDTGSLLTLRPGQKVVDLVFRLAKAGVIAGRVFDEDGAPLQSMHIKTSRETFSGGKKVFEQTQQRESNDLGEFRLFGLRPGRYLVSAAPNGRNRFAGGRAAFEADKKPPERAYVRIYYPGVTSLGKASLITVKPDDQITSIDIFMKKASVYRIHGRVVNLPPRASSKVSHGLGLTVQVLRPGDGGGGIWDPTGQVGLGGDDGSFEVSDVPSGNYTILVYCWSGEIFHAARQDVTVNGDMEDLRLTAGDVTSIPGRVIWDGPAKVERSMPLRIIASSTEDLPLPGAAGEVDDSGQFVLKDIPEGEFEFRIRGLCRECYTKEVRYNGRVLPDGKIQIAKDAAGQVEITLSSRGAHIQGDVLDEDSLPAVGAWVVAIPEHTSWRASYSTNTDQYGHFDTWGLPPGKYHLFSWAGLEEGIWEDPAFLKHYTAESTDVEVSDGDRKTTQLKLIPLRAEDGSLTPN
jgi:hypothetical protein